ncbi:hypothetical protein AGMMS49546_23570 [Spirochaetia bacterium]|nr:hypothetical protein AGMMS49546_23570 [Spirochaetia bacterium]
MENSVSIRDKNFVGVGKFLFDTTNVEWNIPHLHFLVDKTESGVFEATNLEFGLVASGETQESATQRLAGLIHFHIVSVMTDGHGYKEFIETVNSNAMDEYWTVYRVIDFSLGEKGKDLSHEIEKRITRSIQKMFNQQVKDIIIQKAGKRADEILKEYEDLTTFKLASVEYTEIEGAA